MGATFERQFKKLLEERGFFVIRSAGSRAVDLAALHPTKGCYLIEEKSITGDVFRVTKTKDTKDQWEELCRLQKRFVKDNPFEEGQSGIYVLYALHKARQGWRLLLPTDLQKPYHWRKDDWDPAIPLEQWLRSLDLADLP